MLRPRFGSTSMLNDNWRFSASCRNGRPTVSSRLEVRISSASTVTVPDSILDRSRMSLIRLSRSVPAPWMVRANSTCFADRLPSGFSVSCWPRIKMLLSGVRSSCDMLARNSDLYFEVSESSVAFSSSARRACSISWFLRSTSTLRSASCWAFCSSCSLVCCSSFCWVCNSPASCCDCFSRPSVCIVASILLSTMPMLSVSCSRKVICEVVNELIDASSMTALTWFSNRTGSTTRFFGTTRSSAELIGTASAGMSDTSRWRLSIAHCPTRPSPNCTICGCGLTPSPA